MSIRNTKIMASISCLMALLSTLLSWLYYICQSVFVSALSCLLSAVLSAVVSCSGKTFFNQPSLLHRLNLHGTLEALFCSGQCRKSHNVRNSIKRSLTAGKRWYSIPQFVLVNLLLSQINVEMMYSHTKWTTFHHLLSVQLDAWIFLLPRLLGRISAYWPFCQIQVYHIWFAEVNSSSVMLLIFSSTVL